MIESSRRHGHFDTRWNLDRERGLRAAAPAEVDGAERRFGVGKTTEAVIRMTAVPKCTAANALRPSSTGLHF
jgi:hypothetical protein